MGEEGLLMILCGRILRSWNGIGDGYHRVTAPVSSRRVSSVFEIAACI
jgi:hypothetical protein